VLLIAVPILLWTWRANPLPMAGQAYAGWDVVAAVSWLLWGWLVVCVGFEIAAQRARTSDRTRAGAAAPGTGRGTDGTGRGTDAHAARDVRGRTAGPAPHRRGSRTSAAAAPSGSARPAARALPAAPAPRFVRRGTTRLVTTAGVVVAALMSSRAALAADSPEPRPAATTADSGPVSLVSPVGPASAGGSASPVGSASPTGSAGAGAGAGGAAGVDARPGTLVPTAVSHTVQTGESLWSIVEDRYPEAADEQLSAAVDAVFAANRGTADSSGRRLTDPDVINPGMRLALPSLDAAGNVISVTGGGIVPGGGPGPAPGGAPTAGSGNAPAPPGASTGESPRPSATPRAPAGTRPPAAPSSPAPRPSAPAAAPPTAPPSPPASTPALTAPPPSAGAAGPGGTSPSGAPSWPAMPMPPLGSDAGSVPGATEPGQASGGPAGPTRPSPHSQDVPTYQAETWVLAAGLVGTAAVASTSSRRRRRAEAAAAAAAWDSAAGPGGDDPDVDPISVEVLRRAAAPAPPLPRTEGEVATAAAGPAYVGEPRQAGWGARSTEARGWEARASQPRGSGAGGPESDGPPGGAFARSPLLAAAARGLADAPADYDLSANGRPAAPAHGGPGEDAAAPRTPSGTAGPGGERPRVAAPPPYAEPGWQVQITLLGPLGAVDRAGRRPGDELATERTFEVLAWLATHRGRLRAELAAAVWPTGIDAVSVRNRLALARRLLVELAGPEARSWIPSHQDVLRLDSRVVTDVDLLRHRFDYATAYQRRPEVAIPVLTAGLDLVTAPPIHPEWFRRELGSALTGTVVRSALLLGELQLRSGNPDGALAASQRALVVHPAHPGLFALRMRAYAAAGDEVAVTGEYGAYLFAEHANPAWTGETDRDLEILYWSLRRQTEPPDGPDHDV